MSTPADVIATYPTEVEIADPGHRLPTLANPITRQTVRAGWHLSLAGSKSMNTANGYMADLDLLVSFLRPLDLLDAKRVHLDAWAVSMRGHGHKPTTIARRLSSASSFYRYALAAGEIDANPVANVERPATTVEHVALTPGLTVVEVAAMLRAATTPAEELLVRLLFEAGLRVSEAISIDVEQVRWIDGYCTVDVVGKGGKSDRITLSAAACVAVSEIELERSTGPMFVGADGRRITRSAAARLVGAVGRAAGISRKVTPHMLRVSMVTAAIRSGRSLRDVQAHARHAATATTARYDRNVRGLAAHADMSSSLSAMTAGDEG